MIRIPRKLLLALLLAVPCLSAGQPGTIGPLPEFSAEYKVLRNGITIGESTVSLTSVPVSGFLFESYSRAAGLLSWFYRARRREYSHWIVFDDWIRPIEYGFEKTGKDADRSEKLIFDWERKRARQTLREPLWEIDIPERTLDKATMQLALMRDLHYKTDVEYVIADDAKLRRYRFQVLDRQTVKTPAGRFDTVRVQRIRDGKRRSTQFWCAPSLHYLPVQIVQRKEDGTVFRTVLKKFSAGLKKKPGTGDR